MNTNPQMQRAEATRGFFTWMGWICGVICALCIAIGAATADEGGLIAVIAGVAGLVSTIVIFPALVILTDISTSVAMGSEMKINTTVGDQIFASTAQTQKSQMVDKPASVAQTRNLPLVNKSTVGYKPFTQPGDAHILREKNLKRIYERLPLVNKSDTKLALETMNDHESKFSPTLKEALETFNANLFLSANEVDLLVVHLRAIINKR